VNYNTFAKKMAGFMNVNSISVKNTEASDTLDRNPLETYHKPPESLQRKCSVIQKKQHRESLDRQERNKAPRRHHRVSDL
jgi:hypothetical protein